MSRSEALTTSLQEAKLFSSPASITKNGAVPVFETASEAIATFQRKNAGLESRKEVLLEACSHLVRIQSAMISSQHSNNGMDVTLDTGVLSVVFPLLDILLLEGVYPSISKGVGFPRERQKRSSVCNRTCVSFPDLGVLDTVLPVLNDIVFIKKNGLHQQIHDSILLDMIATNADLAYSRAQDDLQRHSAAQKLTQYLEHVSTASLYQSLTVLIKSTAPQWFRNGLSIHLSLVPLRTQGVRQTIEFLASHDDAPIPGNEQPSSGKIQRLLISPEALSNATKILTSVPSSVSETHYFSQIVPQLLSLVDGESGLELSRAASVIITTGILNKRDIGSPGSIGWELLVSPLHQSLMPSHGSNTASTIKAISMGILVAQADVEQSVKRLLAFVSASLSPALTGRLLRPVLLPLWRLTAFDGASSVSKNVTALAQILLEHFLQRCGNIGHLDFIRDNLLWEGEPKWKFGAGEEGGIAIRARREVEIETDILDVITKTDGRVTKLMEVMAKSQLDDEIISTLFQQSLKTLLHADNQQSTKALLHIEKGPMKDLATVQLLQALLSNFSEKLASKPDRILSMVDQLLLETVERISTKASGSPMADTNIQALLKITDSVSQSQSISDSEISDDIVATSISLLNALVSTKEFKKDQNVRTLLRSILSHLQDVQRIGGKLLSQSTMASIVLAISTMNAVMDQESTMMGSTMPNSQQIITRLVDSFTNDPPPIQASSLHSLLSVIDQIEIPLDIPGLTAILLDQIRFNRDTYVHPFLNDALARLTSRRSPGYPLRATVAAFRDADEQTELNGRLRVGEALITVVKNLAEENAGITGELQALMSTVISACLAVAGRRSTRTLEQKEREKSERRLKAEHRSAEKAWGGDIPDITSLQAPTNDERDHITIDKEARANAAIQRIVHGWEGAGKVEDVRVRTTALSLSASVMEQAGPFLTTETITASFDLALAILSFENGEESLILRRAAVLLFMAHLRALDVGLERQLNVPSVDGSKWLEVEESLASAVQADRDDLVREHASDVLESLEALRMKQLLNSHKTDHLIDSNTLELKQLRGLSVVQANGAQAQRPKIDVID